MSGGFSCQFIDCMNTTFVGDNSFYYFGASSVYEVCFCGYCVQDEKYDHIELADMEKVKNAVLEKHQWLETNAGLCNQQPVYVDPPVTVAQINAQREVSLYFITGNLFAVF